MAPPAFPQGQRNFAWSGARYSRRSPESTLLYKVVRENLRSFEDLCQVEGKALPSYVRKEFDAFLRCGVLAYGFLRLRCNDCKRERFVAFSCKKRGFCGSCGARRMSETASHLSDNVFPKSAIIRQWVLSMPVPLRFLCARNSKLQGKILRLVNKVIAEIIKGSLNSNASENLEAGAVTLIQRFGGHVNLNVHFHMLHVQGTWEVAANGNTVTFHAAPNPTNEEIAECVEKIARGTLRILKRMTLLETDEHGHNVITKSDEDSDDPLANIQAASTQNKIALGSRRGQRIRRLIAELEVDIAEGQAQITGPLVAAHAGFSLHAGVSCWSTNKARLEQLVRYTARPAVSEERLSEMENGLISYRLKKPWTDGTTHVVFSPLEFMEKLAALVPPPRIHLTRFHGILAPHSKWRSFVVPEKPEEMPSKDGDLDAGADPPVKPKRMSWAKLLSRVFAIDTESCDHCGGQMKIIAAVMSALAIESILRHLGIPPRPPPIAKSQIAIQENLWDQSSGFDDFSQC